MLSAILGNGMLYEVMFDNRSIAYSILNETLDALNKICSPNLSRCNP